VNRLVWFFVLLVGGVLSACHQFPAVTGPHLLALVPRESLCVVELRQPRQMLLSLSHTPLGKSLTGVNWLHLLKKTGHGFPREEMDSLSQLTWLFSMTAAMLDAPESLVLDTGVFALVPPEAGQEQPGPATGTPLFLGRLRSRHGFARLVSYLERARELRPIHRDRIAGHPFVQYQIPGHGDLYLGHYQDVFILSPVKAVLRQALSLARADVGANNHTLFGDDFFLRGRKLNRKNVLLTVYINVRAIERLAVSAPGRLGLSSLLSCCTGKGLDRIMVNVSHGHGLNHIAALFRFQASGLPALARLCSLRAPVHNRELARVPAGLTTYFWSNWFSPASWWQAYLAMAGPTGERHRKMVNTVLRKYLHLSMAEFTALFAYDWSVFVTEIKQSAFVPVPRPCLRLGMINPDRLASLLQKNIAELPHRLDIVSSIKVTSLIMAGGLMEPSYSFIENPFPGVPGLQEDESHAPQAGTRPGPHGKDLWLFDGYDQVKQFLEPGPLRLVDEPVFQEVAGKTDGPVNLQFFVRMPPVSKGLHDLFTWLSKAMQPAGPFDGEGKRFMFKQFMQPLLTSLTGLEAAFVSARIEPGELETHIRLLAGGKHIGKNNDE